MASNTVAKQHDRIKLAHGRRLTDFAPRQEDLPPAERKLLEFCRTGKGKFLSDGQEPWCVIGSNEIKPERPAHGAIDINIRASFIRFLALGGDEENPVHELGIRLKGAYITEELNLTGCAINVRLCLYSCTFDSIIRAYHASLPGLFLSGSKLSGIQADRLILHGSLYMDEDEQTETPFVTTGQIRLRGAEIGSNLNCTGGQFSVAEKPEDRPDKHPGAALWLSRIQVKGHAKLDRGFAANGEVRMRSAYIKGNLNCSGGLFKGIETDALSLSRSTIDGSLYFDCPDENLDCDHESSLANCFMATGTVRLVSTTIGAEFDCFHAEFSTPENHITGDPFFSILANHLIVKGMARFQQATIPGKVDLTGGYIATLEDDTECWPDGGMTVVGFRYDRLGGELSSPSAIVDRIISKQNPENLNDNEHFANQPWEQLILVLRSMGNDAEADYVARRRERARRIAGRINSKKHNSAKFEAWKTDLGKLFGHPLFSIMCMINKGWVAFSNFISLQLHTWYGRIAGYGYRPARVMVIMVCLWAMSAACYFVADQAGVMGPNSPYIYDKQKYVDCGVMPKEKSWSECGILPPEHSVFSPTLYSADLILPLVDLHQEDDWEPIVEDDNGDNLKTYIPGSNRYIWLGWIIRALHWTEIFFGWLLSLLLLSILTRIVERD